MKYHEMMTNRISLILLLLASIAGTSAAADTSSPYTPNWTEVDALAAIGSVDTATESAILSQLAENGDSDALLKKATAIHENPEWPAPAREFVLFNLARSLGDYPPGQIDAEITRYLASLPTEVRIAHPDHPGTSVPMFNITAAATGAATEWERQAASLEANGLIGAGPQGWLESYVQATPVQRDGFRRSLAAYPDPELTDLADAALIQAATHPELAVIATMAGLRLGDSDLFSSSLEWNDHHGLAEMIRLSREVFRPADLLKILQTAVHQAPAPTASLVIAELAPALLDRTEVVELMIDLLGYPQLGASAALVLSYGDSPRMHARLTAVSQDATELAAKRAGLALAAMEARR